MKRFIALTLALVMLCCCAAGCGSDTKEDTVMTVIRQRQPEYYSEPFGGI